MKRWIAAIISILILLAVSACASKPEPSIPADAYDLAYDMGSYDYFSEIFDGKDMEEWERMGRYTILLKGLHAPVLVAMDGMDVLSVCAYGQTVELGEAGGVFQDSTPVEIRSTEGAVVVNLSWDYDGETILLTADQCYRFQPEDSISTQIFVREDGTLSYRRYWGEYATSFEQWDTAPLDLCTSRDHFLYETGRAEIGNGEVILTPERTVTVSDEYDLDAMFAEAKDFGMYEEYETADALLAANQARANGS